MTILDFLAVCVDTLTCVDAPNFHRWHQRSFFYRNNLVDGAQV